MFSSVYPSGLDYFSAHGEAAIDEMLDRVRNLQLAARRWLDLADRLKDIGIEESISGEPDTRAATMALLSELLREHLCVEELTLATLPTRASLDLFQQLTRGVVLR